MRTIAKLALVNVAFATVACSSGAPRPEAFEQRESAIYYGQLDTTHQAVVTVVRQGSAGSVCSGTIIDVKGQSGYVLTAGHCVTDAGPTLVPVDELFVVMGNDYQQSTNYFAVAEASFHPQYDGADGNPNDFGMLRFVGASASTPSIPAMTPAQDNLAAGTQLDLIGFGQTNTNADNSTRYHLTKPIGQLTSPGSSSIRAVRRAAFAVAIAEDLPSPPERSGWQASLPSSRAAAPALATTVASPPRMTRSSNRSSTRPQVY